MRFSVHTRGDSLWRISRVTYGAGMRYAVVYKANRDQIRNPNRIYPGQIFVLPMKARWRKTNTLREKAIHFCNEKWKNYPSKLCYVALVNNFTLGG